MDNLKSKDYNELYAMLNLLPSYSYLKIPGEKINFIKNHMVENYDVDSEKMDFKNASRKAYSMFVKIYRDYIAEDKEKDIINNILDLNGKKQP